MQYLKKIMVLVCSSLFVTNAHATLITLNFDSLEGTGTNFGSFESYGNNIDLDGYTLTTGAAFGGFISYLPGAPLYSGSIALIPNEANATATLTRTDASAFDITSISLGFSNLAQLGVSDITFFGNTVGGGIVQQIFSINNTLSVYNFNSNFVELTSLVWSHAQADANNHRFDNINVDDRERAGIPEPSLLSILVMGLIMLVVGRKNIETRLWRRAI